MNSKQKTAIAIFTDNYLERSETFIYRQLLGVTNEFDPIVITNKVYNLNIFPFNSIYSKPPNLVDRIYSLISKKLTKNFTAISLRQFLFWKQTFKKNNVRLIHAHFGPAGLKILPLARSLDIPLVVTFHGHDASALLQNKKYVYSLNKLFNYAYVIADSAIMAEKLIALGAKTNKTFVHYIGAPLTMFKYHKKTPLAQKVKANERIVFIQISRFVEKKGHKYTLEAFKEFLRYYPNSELLFAGAGPLESECKKFCKQHHLNNIKFIGPITTKEEITLLQQADVYLQHSITANNGDQEGIPISIMEAMAVGLPIISTLHSGIPELVRNGIDGYLIAEKDVISYVTKMQQILTLKEQDTQNWLRQKFDLDANCKKLCKLYQHVIKMSKHDYE